MIQHKEKATANGMLVSFLILLNTIFLKTAYVDDHKYYWALLISVPLLILAIWDGTKNKNLEN